MKKITLLLSSVVLSSVIALGQNSRKALPIQNKHLLDHQMEESLIQNAKRTESGHIRCFTSEMESMRRAANPSSQTTEEFENWISQKISESANNTNQKKATRNIPVVVHVLYGNATQNISAAQVQSQITALNQDYSATNTDFSSVPSAFQSIAANCDIQFCLATEDPNGQPTDGINRVDVGTTSLTTTAIDNTWKPNTIWDPSQYLNMWVANIGGGILGYATFPVSSGLNGLNSNPVETNSTSGVVILYNAFGTTGAVSSPFNKGRTATHEIGHWLGLRHIWGDDGGACGGNGDFCADTPDQADENYNCPSYPSNASCSNGGDMSMNYMDYVNDACMYMFTAGQKARMDAVLQNSPRRASLLTSNKCGNATITANFTGNPLVINEGQTVTFTDGSSSPDNLNSWVWNFPGGTPNTFNGQNPPAITYSTAGQYDVTLTVGDDNSGSDALTKSLYVTVNPAGTVTCDSLAAGWDWTTEGPVPGAYWVADLCTGNDGYIMGNNCYDDNGWASKVSFSGTGKELTTIMYAFEQSSGSGATTLKVWNADGAGRSAADAAITTAPGTVMAQLAVSSGDFSAQVAAQQIVGIGLSPAIPLTGDFYIGYDHPSAPGAGDTLSMYLVDGTSGNQTWANEAGIGWRDIAFWGVNYKGAVIAVICDIATGVEEVVGNVSEIIVYPNPSTGILSVALTEKGNNQIEVYNMIGERVVTTSTSSNYASLDLSSQPNGVYFVKVTSNGEVTTKKVLLSK